MSVVANVSWSSGVAENHLDTFAIDQLRPVDEFSGEPMDQAAM